MNWINVKDKLPAEGHKVIVYNTALKRPSIGWLVKGVWNELGYVMGDNIGYWMPFVDDPQVPIRVDDSAKDDELNSRDNFTNIAFKVKF